MTVADGGEDADRKECPYRGCDWESREYDPTDTYQEIAAEEDATIHWETEHGGEIPDSAEFGDEQCPECYAVHGLNGTVSCSECGYIPETVRADGGTDPRAALEEYGTLYDGATARGGIGPTVHVDEDCHALASDHDDITEAAELPLRTRVCQKCDPDHEIDYSAGNNPRDDVPAIEDADGKVWADD